MIFHLVQFSGGSGSWATAQRVKQRAGLAYQVFKEESQIHLLFADTLSEDQDTYRFLIQAAANIFGIPLTDVADLCQEALALPDIDKEQQRIVALVILRQHVTSRIPGLIWIAKGETVWEVYKRKRFIGNSRVDPCSYYLKRRLLRTYMEATYPVESSFTYIGIDWTEEHRFQVAKGYWEPWRLRAPLCDEPYVQKSTLSLELEHLGIATQRLYTLGFPHANCSGFCCKAGQGQFKLLLEKRPKQFAYHEKKEQEMRDFLGKDISILKKYVKGEPQVLTLKQLREQVQATGTCDDPFEFGGCGCALGKFEESDIDQAVADQNRSSGIRWLK